MKISYISFVLLLMTVCSCNSLEKNSMPDLSDPSHDAFSLSSDDTVLVNIFNWAKSNSDHYVGNDSDPVGAWYEAALPKREAFCMRDVSHQCIGEELNGHGQANVNMMRKFVENISESKDYCSYWEINRYNLPASVDYESDKDFWYNLNANFDVLQACLRLYKWTGNEIYLKDPAFEIFYRLSLNEYIEHWLLQPEQIMDRPAVMHEDSSLVNPRFRGVRGLPSYEESVSGLRVTGDLIAVIYRAFRSYAEMLRLKGNESEANQYDKRAQIYAKLYQTMWWNEDSQNYYAYKIGDKLIEGGCNNYPLWFGIVGASERVTRLLSILENKETNVESMSYYPTIFYRYGWNNVGYRYLNELYKNKRRDYPEAASGVIEGVVCGLAGVQADVTLNRVTTVSRLTDVTHWISIENIPVFSGKISILHRSTLSSTFVNKSEKDLVWRAMFPGNISQINGMKAEHVNDDLGNTFSYLDIVCKPGKEYIAEVKL